MLCALAIPGGELFGCENGTDTVGDVPRRTAMIMEGPMSFSLTYLDRKDKRLQQRKARNNCHIFNIFHGLSPFLF